MPYQTIIEASQVHGQWARRAAHSKLTAVQAALVSSATRMRDVVLRRRPNLLCQWSHPTQLALAPTTSFAGRRLRKEVYRARGLTGEIDSARRTATHRAPQVWANARSLPERGATSW